MHDVQMQNKNWHGENTACMHYCTWMMYKCTIKTGMGKLENTAMHRNYVGNAVQKLHTHAHLIPETYKKNSVCNTVQNKNTHTYLILDVYNGNYFFASFPSHKNT